MNWWVCGWKRPWPTLRHYPCISLEKPRKPNTSVGIVRDLNIPHQNTKFRSVTAWVNLLGNIHLMPFIKQKKWWIGRVLYGARYREYPQEKRALTSEHEAGNMDGKSLAHNMWRSCSNVATCCGDSHTNTYSYFPSISGRKWHVNEGEWSVALPEQNWWSRAHVLDIKPRRTWSSKPPQTDKGGNGDRGGCAMLVKQEGEVSHSVVPNRCRHTLSQGWPKSHCL
jgi:hypothetical protein